MLLDKESLVPLAALVLPALLLRAWRQGRSWDYAVCLAAFFLYLLLVVGYTLLPVAFTGEVVEAQRQGLHTLRKVNLVPLPLWADPNRSALDYLFSRQGAGNFLLGVPFGLGLPFLVPEAGHLRGVVRRGLSFALAIETAQLLLNLTGHAHPPRVADVNDVMLNLAGVLAGFGLFRLATRLYGRVAAGRELLARNLPHVHGVLLGGSGPRDRAVRHEGRARTLAS